MLSGSRILFSHHFSYHHRCHHHPFNSPHQFQSTLRLYSSNWQNHGFSSTRQALNPLPSASASIVRPSNVLAASFSSRRFRFLSNGNGSGVGDPFVNCIQTPQSHPLSGCLSQNEDCQEPPSERLSPIAGGIVALGKFDALHIGHRELAIQASKVGAPFLLSFAGMAEVLGWKPRAPIVAKCDRKRVLNSWAPYCGNLTPREFQIDFSKVRSLTPRQFVEKLSVELGVRGVVAGQNYRFGYRASGDASDLVRLCGEYGMGAYIISSVMDKHQHTEGINCSDSKEKGQVSSTRVRQALYNGDMKYVSELLGRHHRLVLNVNQQEVLVCDGRVSALKSCLLNLPPVDGSYANCSLFIGDKDVVPCRVIVDTTHIHLELDKFATCNALTFQDSQLLGIEFGE